MEEYETEDWRGPEGEGCAEGVAGQSDCDRAGTELPGSSHLDLRVQEAAAGAGSTRFRERRIGRRGGPGA